METQNARSARRSTLRPWRRKYRAASQGNSPIRVLNVRTTSSVPEVTYNKTGRHVPSKHSTAAPTPALARLQNQYHAYIVMLWKYHGHKGRGSTTAHPECGSTALGAPDFAVSFLYTFRTQLFGRPVRQYTRRIHDATARETASHIECPGGLYNELNTCLT